MIIVNTEGVAGYRVTQSLGVVRGNTIRARHLGNDILAGLRNLVGGEIKEYTSMMSDARNECVGRMVSEAERMGADAVVSVRLTSSSVMSNAAELLAYGTAVKLEKIEG